MQTIQKRSEGLQHLVEAYRSLTHVPKPEFTSFGVHDLVQRIGNLVRPEIAAKGISLECSVVPEDLELFADPQLVEQVVINLVTNALDAVEEGSDSRISIRAAIDERGRGTIKVIDNGPGIEQHALESIFIPFYTTKERGSGIGLSLSRQIMRLHRGTITVQSEPGRGAVFTLRF
jgi:signal transduction histidine kinase